MTSNGSVTISLLSRLAMIAATAALVMLSACAPTVRPTVSGNGSAANGSTHVPTLTADRYVAADGTSLAVAVWPAATAKPKAVILGLHGFGDYRQAWDEPAQIWAKDGISTYSYDQRGFGSSPTRGRWPGTEALVDDANTMIRLLRTEYPGVPVYLAGESMGGAVALVAAEHGAEIDGLVLLATALRTRESFGPVTTGMLEFFA